MAYKDRLVSDQTEVAFGICYYDHLFPDLSCFEVPFSHEAVDEIIKHTPTDIS
jgi:hypothetical protein